MVLLHHAAWCSTHYRKANKQRAFMVSCGDRGGRGVRYLIATCGDKEFAEHEQAKREQRSKLGGHVF
jgi:hypothetical protein